MENNILSYWDRLSRNDFNNYRRNGESLLVRRADGDRCGLRRILLQWYFPNTVTSRRSAALGIEGGETDPDNRRKIQAERRPHMISDLFFGAIDNGRGCQRGDLAFNDFGIFRVLI